MEVIQRPPPTANYEGPCSLHHRPSPQRLTGPGISRDGWRKLGSYATVAEGKAALAACREGGELELVERGYGAVIARIQRPG